MIITSISLDHRHPDSPCQQHHRYNPKATNPPKTQTSVEVALWASQLLVLVGSSFPRLAESDGPWAFGLGGARISQKGAYTLSRSPKTKAKIQSRPSSSRLWQPSASDS